MKLTTILAFILACSLSQAAEYLTSHVGGKDWSLLFPSQPATRQFVDYRLALEVVSVECDGKRVTPQTAVGAFHFNYAEHVLPNTAVVYSVHYKWLETAIWESSEFLESKLLRYEIPSDAKKVQITYRIRMPEGKNSEISTITSCESLTLAREN